MPQSVCPTQSMSWSNITVESSPSRQRHVFRRTCPACKYSRVFWPVLKHLVATHSKASESEILIFFDTVFGAVAEGRSRDVFAYAQ